MNQENLSFLQEQVMYAGFGDTLDKALHDKIAQQPETFSLDYQTTYGKDIVEAQLNFSQSKREDSDMYFFNSYMVNLKSEGKEDMKQQFYINPGNNITLKEAYNLMCGRSVNKNLRNKEGEAYNTWVQMDFNQANDKGNYQLKYYNEKYGFDLDAALQKYPIRELEREDYKANLVESLKKGNPASATLVREGQEDQKVYVVANPRFKSVALFDYNQDRKTRDKFTRIQYETDRYIEKTRQLSSQKVWILTLGIVLLLILSLLHFLNRQYARNKLLHMENQQQKANEQIYLLTLKQQAKLQEARNQERIRISEELHDGILGDLFAIRMDWGFLKLQADSDDLQKHHHYLEELQRIEKDIRDASHELKDKLISYPINFIHIVEKLVQNRGKTGNFKYKLIHDDTIPWEDIDEKVKVNLYRVIEEALQNCIKHAKAELVEVRFELSENNYLRLIIWDNGVGFNLRKSYKGIGIRNMQSRVQKIKGIFHIESERDQGTTLTIDVPV
ncbi:sensor histidine kinase [Sinomicrobium sp. M5D2P9]